MNTPTPIPSPTDFCLRFPGEATAIASLPDYRGEDKDGKPFWRTADQGFCLDVIGALYDTVVDPTATTPVTLEGAAIEIPKFTVTQLDGFHLNLRVLDGRDNPAPDHTVTPKTPRRVWC